MSSDKSIKIIRKNELSLSGAAVCTLLFAALAAFFLTTGLEHPAQSKAAMPLEASWYDPSPPRKINRSLMVDDMACSACHDDAEGTSMSIDQDDAKQKGVFHDMIKLQHGDHGFNTRCFNCHNKNKRDAFTDHNGNSIAYKDVQLLCAKCHGPIYRDWEDGSHGRRNGYWDTSKGKQDVLACIACHDPHSPKFKKIQPAPPPRALHPEKSSGKPHGEARP